MTFTRVLQTFAFAPTDSAITILLLSRIILSARILSSSILVIFLIPPPSVGEIAGQLWLSCMLLFIGSRSSCSSRLFFSSCSLAFLFAQASFTRLERSCRFCSASRVFSSSSLAFFLAQASFALFDRMFFSLFRRSSSFFTLPALGFSSAPIAAKHSQLHP